MTVVCGELERDPTDKTKLTVHERRTDGTWSRATQRDGTVSLAAIDCRLPLAEIYEDLPEG